MVTTHPMPQVTGTKTMHVALDGALEGIVGNLITKLNTPRSKDQDASTPVGYNGLRINLPATVSDGSADYVIGKLNAFYKEAFHEGGIIFKVEERGIVAQSRNSTELKQHLPTLLTALQDAPIGKLSFEDAPTSLTLFQLHALATPATGATR